MHTENPIVGVAKNPHNHDRSCGGSSGGDGGLIAQRCVPIALGTDIGGSVRFPPAFLGIVGFKTTMTRVSDWGVVQASK